MAGRGVHFALTVNEVATLHGFKRGKALVEYISSDLEETYFTEFPQWTAESDKAWDAIHRSLTNGKWNDDDSYFPLNLVIIGGEQLYLKSDYMASLKSAVEVRAIAAVLPDISKDTLRAWYFTKIVEKTCGYAPTEADFEFTWEAFQATVDLYVRAAREWRYVLFTVDL